MTPALEDLQRRVSTLRAHFEELGRRAATVASALGSSVPPDATLVDDLGESRRAFAELRAAVFDEADELAVLLPDADTVTSLRHLEPVLAAVVDAEERRARRAAWEAARETALTVLDRVIELVHREESAFPPLVDCQAKARELHLAISAAAEPDDAAEEEKVVAGRVRPFAELVTLVDGWDVLDDERCAFLQDTLTQSFGRPLALAALRGKLGGENDAPAPPVEPRPARRTMQESAAQGLVHGDPSGSGHAQGAASPAGGGEQAAPQYGAPAFASAPAPAEASAAGAPAVSGGGTAGGGGGAALGGRAGAGGVIFTGAGIASGGGGEGEPSVPGKQIMAPMGGPLVVEIRLTGDKVHVETPEERREREAQLEALAEETAKWWITARAGWATLRARGLGFVEAAREVLHRYPYLLSVPIQASGAHEEGTLAEGYALLLEHVEKQEPGFVTEALTRLNPQFTTRAKDQSYPLGQELYLYVVAEGRLYKTYPEFVKEVMLATLPEPGLWAQGGIVETPAQTRVFRGGDDVFRGEARESTTLTDEAARAAGHAFTGAVGPLTTRFFTVEADALDDPRDVEVKLKENDTPADRAWLATLPPTGTTEPLAVRRHKVGGTTLPDLGRAYRTLWIAVFNPDPSAERRYELTVTLKRKTPPPPPPGAKAAAAPAPAKASPFAFRRRAG